MEKDRNPWVAGIFSILMCGLGHLYAGHAKKGIFLFFIGQGALLGIFVSLLYLWSTVPAVLIATVLILIFYLYCITDAVKLSRRKRYGYKLKSYNQWWVYMGCWILSAFVAGPVTSNTIKKYFVQAYKIPTMSLKPTLLHGDMILAKKGLAVRGGVQRGDMIIFIYPVDVSKDYIKRVVAVGGETIEIVNKEVFIDGNLLHEPYVVHGDDGTLPKSVSPRDNMAPVVVPQDSFFVLGDNRDASNDSRFWGFVEKSQIKGKAHRIYWSWVRDNHSVRWERIGKIIK